MQQTLNPEQLFLMFPEAAMFRQWWQSGDNTFSDGWMGAAGSDSNVCLFG